MTEFSGISSFGVPLFPGGAVYPLGGLHYFVDSVEGADGNTGTEPNTTSSNNGPLATMARALALVASNDVIHVRGDIREQLTAPLNVEGVVITGNYGGNVRHDDGARWRTPASPVATTPLLTLRMQGWEIHNILFVPAANIAAVRIRRAEDATYPDGSHAIIQRCKFIGDDGAPVGIGIDDHGGSHHNTIEDCEFMGLVTAIQHTAGAGIASPLRWRILRSWFATNTNHIVLPCNQCVLDGNRFDPATVVINTSGGTEGKNYVGINQFSDIEADVDNAHGYTGHATDVWRNYSADVAAMTAGVPGA